MPGPRFRTDNQKKVHNDFGKPIHRVAAEGEPKCRCCAKCQQYLQCFKKVPIEVDFKGLDFSDWVEWNQFVWDVPTTRTRTGDFTGDDPDGNSEFIGKFLFLPYDPREECEGQGCFHEGVLEEGEEECLPTCGTHFSPYYRTVHTPSNPEWLNKRVMLGVSVVCCHDEETGDSIGVKFELSLTLEAETGLWAWNADSWWHTPGTWSPDAGCCPILETACIPWAELDPNDWSNLQNLPLSRPTSATDWFGDEDSPAEYALCSFSSFSWWATESICLEFDGEACIDCSEIDHSEGCVNGTFSGSGQGLTCDGVEAPAPVYCIPSPIKFLDPANNTLSVKGNCRPKDCTICEPPTEWEGPKPPAVTPQFAFEVSGAGQGRTFTAVFSDCLDIADEDLYWSFGKTGPTAYHYLNNLLRDSATDYGEVVTLMGIDSRGCVYQYCQLVTAECCSGVSGGLSVTVEPDGCGVEVTASTSGECEDESESPPLIEVQFYSGPNGFGDDCHCDPEEETEEPCLSGRTMLTDGQTITRPGIFHGLRWRVWDRLCGCAGPWTEYPYEITCPTVTVFESHETLDPNVEYSEDCGWAELVRFTWTAEWPAWYCGERVTLAWKHTGYSEGCAEGTIINPGDPEEDQIARHIFTEDVLQKRYAHTIKFWLIGPGFICEGFCTGFPECTALNPTYDSVEACNEMGLPACATA